MAQSTATEGLQLSDVLDDLKIIVDAVQEQDSESGASYDAVQKSLPNLRLHILTYIRFLENHDYVEYDRVGDIIKLSEDGQAASLDEAVWRDKAAEAFARQIDHADDDVHTEIHVSESDLIEEFDVEMDGILDSIGELNDEPVSPSLKIAEDDPTGPEIQAPDHDVATENISTQADQTSTLEPSAGEPSMAELPASNTTSTTESKMNQNDGSYRDRRYSTGSNTAARGGSDSSSPTDLYEREEEIGSGGMGTVFRGRQVKLDRLVAIKEIKEIFDVFAGVQRSDIVQRFTEIVQTQSNIVHPNIVQVIDIDTDARFPFVVMQYAPNGNLRRLIEVDGRPPLQVGLKYFLQILHALSAAHDADVTHGGIKPENVVLDSAGNAMLTDFGISQVVELDSSKANQVYVGVGTVAYMSPEQFRDPNTASVKSDIYSLGIMFYEMLTGKVPGRRSPMPSSFYPDIPRKLDDIFDRMSMDDEDDRFDSVDEILADFYGAPEVMDILDKRGGFVFLRDPIEHGAMGLGLGVTGGESSLDEESSETSLAEESSSLAEDSSDVEDDEHDAESEDGDVLDKLDKYGKLFDEEGDDEEDEEDEEESEAEDEASDDQESEDEGAEDEEESEEDEEDDD